MECLINSYSIMSELLSPQEEDCANEELPFTFQMNTERKRKVKQLQQGWYYLLFMMEPCPCCIHPVCSAIRTAVFSMIICLYFNPNLDLYNSQPIAFAFLLLLLLPYAYYCTFSCAMYGDEIPCAIYCARCFNQ